jgi:hypothetical protein
LHTGTCSDPAAVCQTALCNSTTSTCADNNGTSCATGNACVSNTCKSSHCVPAQSGCYVDSECSEGNYCDRSQLTCVSKLLAGSTLPSDGLHTNVCNENNATAVCQTSKCNSSAKLSSPTCRRDACPHQVGAQQL